MLNKPTARERAYNNLTEPEKDELRQRWSDWEKRYPLGKLMIKSDVHEYDEPDKFIDLVGKIEAQNETL